MSDVSEREGKLYDVAILLGVDPELLKDAMLEAGIDREVVAINVREPKHGVHVVCYPTSILSMTARAMNLEPEELRDAILRVCDVPPGRNANLTVRRR